MKGQFQERPKKAKKNPAAPEENNENKKIKKKAAKEQAKNNTNPNPHQFRPNPMGPQAGLYQQSSWNYIRNILFAYFVLNICSSLF